MPHARVEKIEEAVYTFKITCKRESGEEVDDYDTCDYTSVSSTGFTPLEYGCIGYSEENAVAKYGEDNIKVHHSHSLPIDWTVANREGNFCYMKLICLVPENERVIGFHYLGPHAVEITQSFALGLGKSVTNADVDGMIGIHPTCPKFFTTLTVTKKSGKSTL